MSKYNFFRRVNVSTTNFANHLVGWDFNSTGLLLLNSNTTTGRIVEYSFDGVVVHGDLVPGGPGAGIAFDSRHESKIFLRLKTAGAAAEVRVEAWA